MFTDQQIRALQLRHTPFYFYDLDLLAANLDALCSCSRRYGIKIHYAIKANSEERIARMVSGRGLGVDCVSGNEILYSLRCGFPASGVIFSGVGKSDEEIRIAMDAGIGAFNCESVEEMAVIAAMARSRGVRVPVTVRINPDIDAHTHRYITTGLEENKFGISSPQFERVADLLKSTPELDFKGLHFHVGSQIMLVEEVFSLLNERAVGIVNFFEDRGLEVSNVDFGGGLGVEYDNPELHLMPDYEAWLGTIAKFPLREGRTLHAEPGRPVVAQCGSLISRVLYAKVGYRRTFLILDAGMNDLARPALYGAYHKIVNLSARLRGFPADTEEHGLQDYDVVGPVCESADVWGQGRRLPPSRRGDLVAILSAGAYGQTMSSRYNMRDLPGAVFSDEL